MKICLKFEIAKLLAVFLFKDNREGEETWYIRNLNLNVPIFSVIFSRDKIFGMKCSMNLNLIYGEEIMFDSNWRQQYTSTTEFFSRKIYTIFVVKQILVISNISQMVAVAKRRFISIDFFFDLFPIWIIY